MVGALLLGFVCGVIARVLMPGDAFRNMSGPASWSATSSSPSGWGSATPTSSTGAACSGRSSAPSSWSGWPATSCAAASLVRRPPPHRPWRPPPRHPRRPLPRRPRRPPPDHPRTRGRHPSGDPAAPACRELVRSWPVRLAGPAQGRAVVPPSDRRAELTPRLSTARARAPSQSRSMTEPATRSCGWPCWWWPGPGVGERDPAPQLPQAGCLLHHLPRWTRDRLDGGPARSSCSG